MLNYSISPLILALLLFFFILGGQVIWTIGLVMLCGQFIGARLGAGLVLTKGQN